ncbi:MULTISPECIES: hypothetical protein [Dorea]|uniref:hypothetical protein n=1 Tax=Dorea TaxID=189330 RepID=UPI0013564A38|nr:hypothetical protein [Dorea phocaeensis]
MRVLDMFWMSNENWFYFDGLVPKIREDAPREAKESFKNYLKQLKERNSAADQ